MYVLKGDAQNALRFNQEAYVYNSDDLVIADNYAESLALCGKIDEAKTIYEKILYKEPHFPEAYYGYGLLLYENGEREKGIDLIRQYLDKRFSYLSVKTKEEVESLLSEKIGR
jgi:tetratricopeptide (TPR) repeat protein